MADRAPRQLSKEEIAKILHFINVRAAKPDSQCDILKSLELAVKIVKSPTFNLQLRLPEKVDECMAKWNCFVGWVHFSADETFQEGIPLAGLMLISHFVVEFPEAFETLEEPVRAAIKLHLPKGEVKATFRRKLDEGGDCAHAGVGLDLYEFAWE